MNSVMGATACEIVRVTCPVSRNIIDMTSVQLRKPKERRVDEAVDVTRLEAFQPWKL